MFSARVIDVSTEDTVQTIMNETHGMGVSHVWQLTLTNPEGIIDGVGYLGHGDLWNLGVLFALDTLSLLINMSYGL